jgi:hypothetical protein
MTTVVHQENFDDRGVRHAAAFTDRLQPVAASRRLEVPAGAAKGVAEGVAEGDGTASWVELRHVNAELLRPSERYRRKASLISKASMSAIVSPDRLSAFSVAGTTPVSMSSGSLPVTEKVWKRARGLSPSCCAFSSLMISAADAPSVRGEELPGVMHQSISGNRLPSSSS